MPILGSGILAACLLLPTAAHAQGLTGALLGTVKDTQGGVIPGVTVTVASPASIGGPVTATTDDRGVFRFPALPPGVYEIEAGSAGFQTYHEKDVPIGAGVTIERPIVLKPAGVVESVSVEASGTDIDARNPGIATRFTEEDLRTIPTRRASMFDALRSTPGINPTSPSSGT